MNKTELIAVVAEKAELSKKDAEKAIKAFTDAVSEELVKGGKIQLVDFARTVYFIFSFCPGKRDCLLRLQMARH